MKKILFAFPIFWLSSCVIQDLDNTSTHVYLKNTTTHEILVLSYFTYGVAVLADTVSLSPDSTQAKANWDARGLEGPGGFSYGYGINGNRYVCDSVRIIFDGRYSVSHYPLIAPSNVANRHYDFSSLRNMLNRNSYDYSFKDSKHHREATYIYTFTDSDYVYATQ